MNILIVGGTGTLGNELTKQLAPYHHVSIFSRDELKQQEMRRRQPNAQYILGDIRDKSSIKSAIRIANPDVVYHVAALKQVDTCEDNPGQCIQTNVNGTINLAQECVDAFVPYMAFSSSDKACLPVNIYGQCKAVSERYLLGMNTKAETKFSVFRWGNVVGSRGSAIPFFVERIKHGLPVPITDERMTRFWISIEEAAFFFSKQFAYAPVSEPLFPDMKAARVVDVVRSIGRIMCIQHVQTETVGIRPGEKIHETIFSSHSSCIRSDTAEQFSAGELDDLLQPVVKKVLGAK